MQSETDVIVIGAGVSGLVAARSLSHRGVRVRVLEASPRVGGRVHPVRIPDWSVPVELGAEFVHGEPSTTLSLAESEGLELREVADVHVLREGEKLVGMGDTWGRFAAALEKAVHLTPAWSVQKYLDQHELPPEAARLVRLLVEGFHAAPLTDIGVKGVAEEASEQAEGYRQFRIQGGYEQLLSGLEGQLSSARVEVSLGAWVRRIDWKQGEVTASFVRGSEEHTLRAARCLATVSIGVLQAEPDRGGLQFWPPLTDRRHALNQLAMGQVQKVVLRLKQSPFSLSHLTSRPKADFFHDPEAEFPTIWLQAEGQHVQVTAWAGGPKASALRSLSASELRAHAIRTVARTLSCEPARLEDSIIGIHTHDFSNDPLTQGAYSYVRPGGLHAARKLALPIENTLFFCGEALDLAYPGTVAGALGSGQHAARQILASLRGEESLVDEESR